MKRCRSRSSMDIARGKAEQPRCWTVGLTKPELLDMMWPLQLWLMLRRISTWQALQEAVCMEKSLQGKLGLFVWSNSLVPGNLQWDEVEGNKWANDRGDGIAIDASGNAIVVVGSTEGTLGARFHGNQGCFLHGKLSTSTGHANKWLTQLGSTAERTMPNGVQIHAASGDVFFGW